MLFHFVRTNLFWLSFFPSGMMLDHKTGLIAPSNSFLKNNLCDFNCTIFLERVINGMQSMFNPLITTLYFDISSEPVDELINVIFQSLVPLQLSNYLNLSSILTFLFIDNDVNITNYNHRSEFWNPANYYFINVKNRSMDDMQLLSKLWEDYQMFNVFIFSTHSDDLVSYNPITKELENLSIENLRKTQVFDNRFHNWKQNKFYLIFPGRLKKKNNGKLKIGTYDHYIIKTITRSLNSSPVFLETLGETILYGSRDKNGSYLGTFKWLINGRAYMTSGAHFLKLDSVDAEIPFSHYITMQKLCFTCPEVEQLPHFKAILKLLNVFVMGSIILMYFVAGIILRFLRFLTLKTQLKNRLSSADITLSIISLLLGMSFYSKLTMSFERVIVGSLLLVNFVITATFQSTLTTVLSKPMYSKRLETKEDLINSQVEIWSSTEDIVHDLRKNGYSAINFQLRPRNVKPIYENVGWMEKVDISLQTSNFKYRTMHNYFTNECPVTYSMVYFFNKGLPSKKKINLLISTLIETGHIIKYVQNSFQRKDNNVMYEEVKIKEESKPTKPLTLSDMKFIFVLFSYNLAFSILVFKIEVTVHFLVKKYG